MLHLLARLALHDNGQNVHLCEELCKNIYCLDKCPCPGGMIAEYKDTAMEEYYAQFEKDKSLIFYYDNYDNSFCGDDKKCIFVGVSRIKEILTTLKFENQGEEYSEKNSDLVCGRVMQSHYLDEGFRIPYENYVDNEELFSKLIFITENSRSFGNVARSFSDDDALEFIEGLIEIVNCLIELGDKTEDWTIRLNWLSSIMTELWHYRGKYTGISSVLGYLGGSRIIPLIKKELGNGVVEEIIYEEVNKLLNGDLTSLFLVNLI